ncbi:MAG: phosphoribosylglycinamide formyltransferase [Terriglobia bacterium]
MKNLGILISGRGSNFEAIAKSVAAGEIAARISIVISNREGARGLDRAREMGLNALCLPSQDKPRDSFENELCAALDNAAVDFICLAGFMRVLSPGVTRRYPQRILNIHPSLLPAFPGADAQRQALEHGVKLSGCTVHLVDEGVDNGPIVLQAAVPVLDDDTVETLSARILAQEHQLYPQAVRLLVEDRIRVESRRVFLKQ